MVVTIFGDGKKPANFISAEDVAKFIVIAMEDPRMRDQVVDIGGPQNFTLDEVADLYGRVAGRQVRKTHLPYAAMRWISKILWPIQEGPARMMAMAASIETAPLELDMTTTIQPLPDQPDLYGGVCAGSHEGWCKRGNSLKLIL